MIRIHDFFKTGNGSGYMIFNKKLSSLSIFTSNWFFFWEKNYSLLWPVVLRDKKIISCIYSQKPKLNPYLFLYFRVTVCKPLHRLLFICNRKKATNFVISASKEYFRILPLNWEREKGQVWLYKCYFVNGYDQISETLKKNFLRIRKRKIFRHQRVWELRKGKIRLYNKETERGKVCVCVIDR